MGMFFLWAFVTPLLVLISGIALFYLWHIRFNMSQCAMYRESLRMQIAEVRSDLLLSYHLKLSKNASASLKCARDQAGKAISRLARIEGLILETPVLSSTHIENVRQCATMLEQFANYCESVPIPSNSVVLNQLETELADTIKQITILSDSIQSEITPEKSLRKSVRMLFPVRQ